MSSTRGFYLPQDGHLVSLIIPKDLNIGAINSAVIRMQKYNHASIIVSYGVASRAAGVITIESCSDMTPTVHTPITFSYYQCITAFGSANDDVLSAIQNVTVPATGLIPAAAITGCFYVIELDSEHLTAGHIGFRACFAACGAASIASAICILSGTRYAVDQSATVDA
jgi:hypothetical protein